MSALTKISFKPLGFLKAKTGGSLKILHNSGCFCMVVQCSWTRLDKLLSAGWYVMTDIYNKPTDKHPHRQNCYPKHCTKSIPYSQLSESNASAPMNKLPKNGLGNWNVICLAVGIAVYMMNSSPVCVLLYFCVHWMFLQVIHRLESHFWLWPL
jgi:hypothetical protein